MMCKLYTSALLLMVMVPIAIGAKSRLMNYTEAITTCNMIGKNLTGRLDDLSAFEYALQNHSNYSKYWVLSHYRTISYFIRMKGCFEKRSKYQKDNNLKDSSGDPLLYCVKVCNSSDIYLFQDKNGTVICNCNITITNKICTFIRGSSNSIPQLNDSKCTCHFDVQISKDTPISDRISMQRMSDISCLAQSKTDDMNLHLVECERKLNYSCFSRKPVTNEPMNETKAWENALQSCWEKSKFMYDTFEEVSIENINFTQTQGNKEFQWIDIKHYQLLEFSWGKDQNDSKCVTLHVNDSEIIGLQPTACQEKHHILCAESHNIFDRKSNNDYENKTEIKENNSGFHTKFNVLNPSNQIPNSYPTNLTSDGFKGKLFVILLPLIGTLILIIVLLASFVVIKQKEKGKRKNSVDTTKSFSSSIRKTTIKSSASIKANNMEKILNQMIYADIENENENQIKTKQNDILKKSQEYYNSQKCKEFSDYIEISDCEGEGDYAECDIEENSGLDTNLYSACELQRENDFDKLEYLDIKEDNASSNYDTMATLNAISGDGEDEKYDLLKTESSSQCDVRCSTYDTMIFLNGNETMISLNGNETMISLNGNDTMISLNGPYFEHNMANSINSDSSEQIQTPLTYSPVVPHIIVTEH